MKISIITINYNNIEGLKQTVESVLSQTYIDKEYIVIDGGSKDGAVDFLKSQNKITYWVSEKDGGLYNAMNKGIRKLSGDYVIFMNSGDVFLIEMYCQISLMEQSIMQMSCMAVLFTNMATEVY